jgi:DNA polymerase III psi subunit
MKTLLDAITEQANRLRQSRPGIADWAMREHRRLSERLESAQALAEDIRLHLAVRALEAQAEALVSELARLSAPAPHTRGYAHG